MKALEQAAAKGDAKFIKTHETYKKLTAGEINKEQAVEILGNNYKNTVTMWLKESPRH